MVVVPIVLPIDAMERFEKELARLPTRGQYWSPIDSIIKQIVT
jgi:hypothetical protein